jgi:hypothetical protein
MNLINTHNSCNLPDTSILKTIQTNFTVLNYGSSFATTGGGGLKKTNNIKNNFYDSFFSNSMKTINNYFKEKISYNNLISNIKHFWNNNKNKNTNLRLNNKNSKNIINNLVTSNYSIDRKNNINEDRFNINKIGGSKTILPLKWFDNNLNNLNINCPKSVSLPSYYENNNKIKVPEKSCTETNLQGGSINLDWTQDTSGTGYRTNGDSSWMGSNIPENINQTYNNIMNGKTTIFNQPESSILNSKAQYNCQSNNCNISYLKPLINEPIQVVNIDSNSKYSLADTTRGYIYPNSLINTSSPIHLENVPNLRA